jgi:hypothetical protein
MTFCLIRYEICNLTRKITYVPPGPTPCALAGKSLTIEDKERMVREVADHLETTYLQYCDNAGPLYWVAATVARLIIAKVSLILYHPLTQPGKPNSLSQDIRDRLFMASVEIMEYSRVLESEVATKQWGWLFQTYIQWHALAYILGELCIRPNSTIVDRAWRCIDLVFNEWAARGNPNKDAKDGKLWQPMHKLLAKAMKKRELNTQTGNNDTENNGLGIPNMYMRPQPEAYSSPSPNISNSTRDRRLERQTSTVYGDASNSNTISSFSDPMTTASTYSNDAMAPQIVGGTDTGMENNLLSDYQAMQAAPQSWTMGENNIGMNATANMTTGGMDPYFPGIGAGLVDIDVEDMADVSWEGWDEMVRDYQMEQDLAADAARGPTLGGSKHSLSLFLILAFFLLFPLWAPKTVSSLSGTCGS